MLAYKQEWLDNKVLHEEAEEAYRQQCISKEEKERIFQAYPVPFYTPNIFIRIGLFLLTVVIVLFSFGLFGLMFIQLIKESWQGLIIFFGLITYGALEFMIRETKHHRSGVDDALLWGSISLLLSGIIMALPNDTPYLVYSLIIFMVTAYAALRFADTLMSIAAVIALLACLFYAAINMGTAGRIAAPLLLMIASYGIYAWARKWDWKTKWRHYRHCGSIIEITTLLTGYLSVNYLVVREASNEFFDLNLEPGQSIPGAWLFWIFTVLIPLAYIAAGIWKKNVILLRTGLVLIAGIVLTVKQYHHMAPIELEMTLGGLIMIGIAYVLIRYLKTPKHDFTSQEIDNTHLLEKIQGESLVVSESFTPTPTPAPGFNFGGGTGGGGGAQGGW